MRTVPFTPAHAAAILPFRRTGLIPSALVIGSFAPDIEYFLRLTPGGGYGHTLPGIFVLDLPLALIVLWLYHRYMKHPLWAALPAPMRRLIDPGLSSFPLRGARRLALVAASILVGTATHLAWDSFTHTDYWPARHWRFLRTALWIPGLGPVMHCKILQYASSVAGIAILAGWYLLWARTAHPVHPSAVIPADRRRSRQLIQIMAVVALTTAAVRAVLISGVPSLSGGGRDRFLGMVATTSITLLFVQLLVYGVVLSRRRRGPNSIPL